MIAQTHPDHSSEMIGEVLMQFADAAGSTFGAEETCVNSSSKHNGSRNIQAWIEDLSSWLLPPRRK